MDHNRATTLKKGTALKNNSVTHRFFDFWLIGGASILVLLSMFAMNLFRTNLNAIQYKFMMFGAFFALASALCNYPHFIITYRFGYTRGYKFIFKYWFSLIVVPVSLLVVYITAFYFFDRDPLDFYSVQLLNKTLELFKIDFQFGTNQTLGPALLSLSIWIMYITVGWHYSKQAYGCMMVYDRYDQYGLSQKQKLWIRYSLLLLALYQFLHMSKTIDSTANSFQDLRFPGLILGALDLPNWLHTFSLILTILGVVGTVAIFIERYIRSNKLPSAPFLIPWIAIYAWWIQIAEIPEFYYMAVPFFHSLQYLPFAGKMELATIPKNRIQYFNISLRIILLLVIGVMLFEFVPGYLDQSYNNEHARSVFFFATSFAVFLNIHHFFIDSTVWKLDQKEMREAIL